MFIYKITNLINSKMYIGYTTKTIQERFDEHIKDSKSGGGYYLHNSMREYGFENFKIEEILRCFTKEQAKKFEIHFIKKFKTNVYKYGNEFGYNLTDGGDGGNGSILKGDKNPNFRGKSVTEYQRIISKQIAINNFCNPEAKKKSSDRMKMLKAEKNYNFGKRYMCITNETVTKQVELDSEIPKGWRRGQLKKTKETCKKISESKKEAFRTGKTIHWNTGRICSEETKQRISLTKLKQAA